MDWENIEERLRADQQAYQHSVDTNALWEAVQPHIPQEEKKNRILFWIWTGLSTAATIALLWVMIGTGNKVPAIDLTTDTNAINNMQNQQLEMIVDTYTNQNIQKAAFEKIKTINLTPTFPRAKKDFNLETAYGNSSNINKAKFFNSSIEDQLKEYANYDIPNTPYPVQVNTPQNENNTENVSGKIEINNFPVNLNPVSGSIEFGTKNINLTMLPLMNGISPFSINAIYNQVIPEMVLTKQIHPFKKNSPHWFVELAGGVSTGHGQLSINDDDLLQSYNSRALAEERLLSYSFRAHLGLQLSTAWSITTGLNYSNLYKRSIKTIQFTEDLSLDDAVVQEIYSVDGLQVVRGSIDITQQITRKTTRINSLKSIEIPLTILHSAKVGPTLFDFGAGIATTIYRKHTGYIHPFNDREYNIEIDENSWYKNGMSLSSHITGGVSFAFSDRSALFSRIRYQHYFDGLNNPSYGIQESASNYHLELGTRIRL